MSAASLAEWVDAVPPRRLALLAAVGGALVGALAVLAASAAARRRSVRAFKARAAAVTSVGDNANTAVSTPGVLPPRPHVPEEFVREQLARNYAFLGEESMAKVRGAFVVVVGVGGVGSHAAHMLARSGVQRLRLVDFDQVTLSSLNRHAVAKLEDVGTPKVACIARRLKEVAPNLVIEMETALFDMAAASRLLAGKPDFVLDCIDNIETKADLIDYCVKNGIRVLASMGAGAKADPSRIQIADISETFEDPLARVTRRGLRLRGIEKGVPVVYSIEKPNSVKLLPLDEAKVDDAHEFSVLPNFRSRILPVLGTLPALFGCTMASFVVTELAGFPLEPLPVKLRHKTYDRVYKDLKNESKESPEGVEGGKDEMKLSLGDIGFLLDEVFHGKSALSGSFEKVTLTRWDPSRPYEMGNMVCLTRREARDHAQLLSPKPAVNLGAAGGAAMEPTSSVATAASAELEPVACGRYGDAGVAAVRRRLAEQLDSDRRWRHC